MTNKKIKPKVEQAEEKILEYINHEQLSIGDKIPNEFELTQIIGVGRGTIREAIRSLCVKGMLEIRRGDGTYINNTVSVIEDPLGLSHVDDKIKLIYDLFEIRFLLEPRVAELAARYATEEQIQTLVQLCQHLELQIQNKESHLETDLMFHSAIAECCGNLAMPNLLPLINQSLQMFYNVTADEIAHYTIEAHRAIVDAIQNRNGESARDAMLLHLLTNKQHLLKRLDK